ncbi:MAG: 1-phosphofructokinase family hexose kinase [Clostridia bacterium]|nr:1-phosphofructokinase family hexose kinase [Clostridia bacterium]
MNIVTLTLCPAFDIHCTASSFTAEQENLATVTDQHAGGKGVNISRALTAYGINSTAVVVLGEENGESFAASLARDGLDTRPLYIPGRIRENVTVHVPGGRETRLSFTGARAPADLMARVTEILDPLCNESTVLTLTGRLPDGLPISEVKQLIARLTARGVRVVIDSRSFSLDDLIEVRPFLIKPNEEEIAAYTGKRIRTTADALTAARALHERGIENVMISLGGTGAVLACAEGDFTVTAPTITPLSTIGAGDSSIAGFLSALAEGKSPADCLHTAVAFGSAACLTPGTQPPKKEDVLRFLE